MIQCSSCGKVLDKVPSWLTSANVAFVCNNCPNRQTKNIAFLTLESDMPKTPKLDEDLDVDLAEEEEAED
jgi:hypothetical protein